MPDTAGNSRESDPKPLAPKPGPRGRPFVKGQVSPGRVFLPGQSGNPSGRPAIAADFRAKCKAWLNEDGGGFDQLLSMATGSGREAFNAAQLLAAYAVGKPQGSLKLSGDEVSPLEIIISRRSGDDDDAPRVTHDDRGTPR